MNWRPYNIESRKFCGWTGTRREAEKQITRMTAGKRDVRSNWIRVCVVVVRVTGVGNSFIDPEYKMGESLQRLFKRKTW